MKSILSFLAILLIATPLMAGQTTVALTGTGTGGGLVRTDNFNRGNENPLAGNWTTSNGFADIQLKSNMVGPTNLASAAYWNADTFANNQSSQVTIIQGTGLMQGGPAVRLGTTGGAKNGYALESSVGYYDVYRYTAGTAVQISTHPAATITSGTVIEMQITGTGGTATIKVYVDAVLKETITDTSAIDTGQPGVFIYTWGTGDEGIDNWEGKNI